MTLPIQTHPEKEYRRLRKAVLDMPIRQKRKVSKGDLSAIVPPNMKIVEFVNTSNTLSQSTQIFQSHPPPANRCATYRSMIVDASASSYPQTFNLIPLSTSKSLPIKVPRRRRETDEDELSYGERPRRDECAGSNDKRPLKKT